MSGHIAQAAQSTINTMLDRPQPEEFGANSWLVEEMYEQYRNDPASVGTTWQEFFSDFRPAGSPRVDNTAEILRPLLLPPEDVNGQIAKPAKPVATSPGVEPPAPRTLAPVEILADPAPEPLRGVPAAIATNMERSLSVPTATSFRNVPAKLLEVNRKVINNYRGRTGQGKVSFTHLIGYAVVRAIADSVPNMKNSYAIDADGKAQLQKRSHVNIGLAVDVDKGNGQRSLVVPVLRHADTLDFAGFLFAYDDIIRKVRANKLTADDYAGANVSLTNPGTIGTVQSVPRLMPGQGVIVGVGSIDYPAEFQGSDERTIVRLGISKVSPLRARTTIASSKAPRVACSLNTYTSC